MSVTGFCPMPIAKKGQQFTPSTVIPTCSSGFTEWRPRDMVRAQPSEQVEPLAAKSDPQHSEPVGEDDVPAPVAVPKMVIPDKLRVQAVAEGYAQGRAEAEEEFAAAYARLDAAANTLGGMLAHLTSALDADTEALAQALEIAIRAMASERAGTQIDDDPPGFAARIETMARRVSDAFSTLTVTLNPQDLAALRTACNDTDTPDLKRLLQADLRPDPMLLRGDIRVRGQGVALDDLIMNEAAK